MPDTLIQADELAATGDRNAIFDCRFSLADAHAGRAAFDEAHIPGAHYLDMENDLAGEKTGVNGRHPLPKRGDFEALLQRCGLDSGRTVVVYDEGSLAGAARAWWLLRFFGVDDCRVLDGGFTAWRQAGLPTESGAALRAASGNIRLDDGDTSMIAGSDDVAAMATTGDGILVDSREPARFAGREEPIDPVAGRIPGAVNVPWTTVTDDKLLVRPAAEQAARWQHLPVDSDPVVYCGSGITASVNLLSLHLAGRDGARLYPGSFSEWCADSRRTVERDP